VKFGHDLKIQRLGFQDPNPGSFDKVIAAAEVQGEFCPDWFERVGRAVLEVGQFIRIDKGAAKVFGTISHISPIIPKTMVESNAFILERVDTQSQEH